MLCHVIACCTTVSAQVRNKCFFMQLNNCNVFTLKCCHPCVIKILNNNSEWNTTASKALTGSLTRLLCQTVILTKSFDFILYLVLKRSCNQIFSVFTQIKDSIIKVVQISETKTNPQFKI